MVAKRTSEWEGDVPIGADTPSGKGSISGSRSFKTRFDDALGFTPEQLIAAAHAACFSMALSNLLAQTGQPSHSLQTEATVTLGPVDGAPTITKIALVTVGQVPGLDELAFVDHVLAARARCRVSRALGGVLEITLEAFLVQ
jgi:osmotically inducible protein OsmC